VGSLRAFVRKERLLVALLVFAAAFFAYRWAVDLQRPGAQTQEGWRGFIDQGGYLREAVALGNLHTIPEVDFAFGPGYPALAAPFTTFGDRGWPFDDPFLPANMAIWLLTVAATYLVGRRLFDQWSGLAAALGLMLATPLIGLMTLPWNTTASLGALMVTMLVALARRLVWWHGLVLGLAIAFAFSARYPDALWVAIPAVGIVVARGALSRRSLGVLWGLATGTVLGLLPTLYLQWKAFGDPLETPYSTGPNQAGLSSFDVGDIPSHALQTFISPFFFHESGHPSPAQPLLSSMFIIALAPVGFALAVRASHDGRRLLLLAYGVASLLATLFYLAYWFTGSYGLGFGAVHFFKMWFPLWTIAATAAVVVPVRALAPQRAASRR
jgi:hypothetical protein